jgi:hypothetical protein
VAGSARAHAAIELAAGRLEAHGVVLGDRLFLAPDHQPPTTRHDVRRAGLHGPEELAC